MQRNINSFNITADQLYDLTVILDEDPAEDANDDACHLNLIIPTNRFAARNIDITNETTQTLNAVFASSIQADLFSYFFDNMPIRRLFANKINCISHLNNDDDLGDTYVIDVNILSGDHNLINTYNTIRSYLREKINAEMNDDEKEVKQDNLENHNVQQDDNISPSPSPQEPQQRNHPRNGFIIPNPQALADNQQSLFNFNDALNQNINDASEHNTQSNSPRG
jgi:hypothetical protein